MLAIVVVAVAVHCVNMCVCVPKLLGKVDLILYACVCVSRFQLFIRR